MSKEEKKTKKKKKSGLITGIIVGGAIGSVASLMFAPDTGKKTRKRMKKQGEKLFGEGKSKAEKFLDKYGK